MARVGRVVATLALVVLAGCAGGGRDADTAETDSQWSGYVSAGGRFTDVSATFTVPSVSCPHPDMNASFWVGLDGYGNTTVEQVGVEALCRSGVARYSGWWQAYPAPPQPLDLVVVPGHEMTARVSVGAPGVRFELLDLTSAVAFETTVSIVDAELRSAEVVAEQSGASQGPLSDFGEVGFRHATVNGRPLHAAGARPLVMTDNRDMARVAVSPLNASGDAFGVRWLSA